MSTKKKRTSKKAVDGVHDDRVFAETMLTTDTITTLDASALQAEPVATAQIETETETETEQDPAPVPVPKAPASGVVVMESRDAASRLRNRAKPVPDLMPLGTFLRVSGIPKEQWPGFTAWADDDRSTRRKRAEWVGLYEEFMAAPITR